MITQGNQAAPVQQGMASRITGVHWASAQSVGFKGNTYIDGFPSHAGALGVALSAWLNFGVVGVPDFTADPAAAGAALYVTTDTSNGFGAFAANSITDQTAAQSANSAFSWPVDGATTNDNWAHLMLSALLGPGDNGVRLQISINDTLLADVSVPDAVVAGLEIPFVGGPFSPFSGQALGSFDLFTAPFLKAALSEFIIYPAFIDWSSSTNRNKFQTTRLGRYRAVDIGNGAALGFGDPLVYLTGDPPNFLTNRAPSGGTLTLHGDPLVLIPSSPRA